MGNYPPNNYPPVNGLDYYAKVLKYDASQDTLGD